MQSSAAQTRSLSRRETIRWLLFRLLATILIPSICVIGFMAWRYAQAERSVIEAQRFDQVNNLSFLVDGEIRAVLAVVTSLAASPELQENDFDGFRRQAMASRIGKIDVIALLDPSGKQIVSTARGVGEPLPQTINMVAFAPVIAGKTVITDVIMGTVVQKPIVAVAAPVFRGGQVTGFVSGVVFLGSLQELFATAGVNPDWAAAVVDHNGRFVARNINPGATLGRAARPELLAAARGDAEIGSFSNSTLEGVATENSFRRSPFTGWTSVVSAPTSVLLAPFYQTVAWVLAAGLAVSLLGFALAMTLANRIARTIRLFGDAASALIEGRALPATPTYISELADIRLAYEHAQIVAAARNESDARNVFLVKELAHRSKNLLAVVQSIAYHTARSASSVDDFKRRFSDRLRGLAASHDFLFADESDGVLLDRLIAGHLAPFGDRADGRIDIECPDIVLDRSVVQPIGMAINELATNAIKYGALSLPGGKVVVTLDIADDQPDGPLQLIWTESGGPATAPPEKAGFGKIVVDEMVAAAVKGRAELGYEAHGLRWRLTVAREFFRPSPGASSEASQVSPGEDLAWRDLPERGPRAAGPAGV